MAFVVDRKLWLNADRSRVVEDGDPDAAYLLASKGKSIPDDVAARFNLNGSKGVRQPPADKSAQQVPNKAVAPGATKGESSGAGGPGDQGTTTGGNAGDEGSGDGHPAGAGTETTDALAEAVGDAKVAEALRAKGFDTPETIGKASDEDLRAVEGVGAGRLAKLRAFAAAASASTTQE